MKPVVGLLRQLGIRIVIYLDDILVMAQTQEEMAKCHATTTINLLESLGFTVNYQKSVLIPSTTIEFLGFLLKNFDFISSNGEDKENPLPSMQQLSQLLGYLTSTIQAVFPAPIHFRYLQIDKNKALSTCQD